MRKGESTKVMNRGGIEKQYDTLLAKRPLLPSDIKRLEILMALIMHRKAQHASK